MQICAKGFLVLCLGSSLLLGVRGFAQSSKLTDASPASATGGSSMVTPEPRSGALQRFGMGVKVSMLGGGVEGAAQISHRSNVRAGFNMFNYNNINFTKDNVAYAGQLKFKTIEAHYDYFPWAGSFHISPGMLTFLGDPVSATASVGGATYFTLNGHDYESSPTDPVHGTAKFDFNRAAPEITVGWGNLVSRREGKHLTAPFELGIAFQGAPKSTLALAGSVCDSGVVNCRTIASDASIQAQVQAEQTSLNSKMSAFKYYPILSLGFGFKF